MTKPTYTILDSFKFISAVTEGNMALVLEVFAANPDAWKWREDRDDDFSALHHAISGQQPAMVDLLIRKGAQLELGAKNEMKPLMLAARSGNVEIVSLLLEAGADARARDAHKKTALDYIASGIDKTGHVADKIRRNLTDAMEDPAKGRTVKSDIGLARAAAFNEAVTGGIGKGIPAATARFRKRVSVLP